jgi:hypothetical protein
MPDYFKFAKKQRLNGTSQQAITVRGPYAVRNQEVIQQQLMIRASKSPHEVNKNG